MKNQTGSLSGGLLAEQLKPLASRLRTTHSLVRPVSQSVIEFRKDGATNQFVAIRDLALNWINNRAGRPLPQHALSGESFELEDIGSQRVAAISIDQPRYWGARLDDSDREVAQRNWVNEISVAEADGGAIILGSRLLCVSRGEDRPFQPSIQSFLRTAIERIPGARVEGRSIETAPWTVETEEDVELLASLILNKERRLDVLVCSLPEGSVSPNAATVNAQDLHRRTYGAAHVAVITSPASYILSNLFGKEFSTFNGAVRTYRAGFDTGLDEPFNHPLSLPMRISTWAETGARAYENFIVGQLLSRSANGRDNERVLPPFSELRRVASSLKLSVALKSETSDVELLKLADREISELRDISAKDKETYQGLVEQYERERDQAIDEAQQTRATNANLRQRLRSLEALTKNRAGKSIETVIPNSLEDFETWCHENLSGAVEIHNRALQGAKKSMLEDCELIFQSLLMLRDFYVPMRREGGNSLMTAFNNACAKLQLTEEQTFSGEGWAEHGEQYRVRYAGKPRLLERHLKKGNSKDQRYCFRLYFFWDEETEQVVVGWLPSHLDTRAT